MTEKRDIVSELVERIPSGETRQAVMTVITAMATMRVGHQESDGEKLEAGRVALERGVGDLRGTLAPDLALIEQAVTSLATLRDVSLLTFDDAIAARSQALAEALQELTAHVQTEAWPALSPSSEA